MKITEYPSISELTEDMVLVVDGNDGTRQIPVNTAVLSALHLTNTALHRTIMRGKYLGASLTTEQIASIQAGTFDDLWLGDYWIINGITWRIVDFNYWYGTGDTAFAQYHIVVMPDSYLYLTQMNGTNTTEGGYAGSDMRTSNLASAETIINDAFGSDHVLSHREYLTNAVTDGHASAGAWYDSTVDLPNEVMMYGSYINTAASTGDMTTSRYTVCKTQLALMRANPVYICPNRQGQWLRDVVTASYFAIVYPTGGPSSAAASLASFGARPVFAIG